MAKDDSLEPRVVPAAPAAEKKPRETVRKEEDDKAKELADARKEHETKLADSRAATDEQVRQRDRAEAESVEKAEVVALDKAADPAKARALHRERGFDKRQTGSKDPEFVVISDGLGRFTKGDQIHRDQLPESADVDRLLEIGAMREFDPGRDTISNAVPDKK